PAGDNRRKPAVHVGSEKLRFDSQQRNWSIASATGARASLDLDPTQLEALRRLHEHFARRWSNQLSSEIQNTIHAELVALDTATYAELALSSSVPNCFVTLSATPWSARMILKIEPSILYPIFDWMLGGGGELSAIPRRPMTEIETRLADRVVAT